MYAFDTLAIHAGEEPDVTYQPLDRRTKLIDEDQAVCYTE